MNPLITVKETAALVGVSRRTLDRMAKNTPDFPKCVRLTSQIVRYNRVAVEQWLAAQGA